MDYYVLMVTSHSQQSHQDWLRRVQLFHRAGGGDPVAEGHLAQPAAAGHLEPVAGGTGTDLDVGHRTSSPLPLQVPLPGFAVGGGGRAEGARVV